MRMPPSDAFLQKRQPSHLVLVFVLAAVLGGCASDQPLTQLQPGPSSCLQQSGTARDERAFVCIDRCHRNSDLPLR
jgi:uncharacterized protein YceK